METNVTQPYPAADTHHPAFWTDVDAALLRLYGIDTADGLPDVESY